MRCQFKGVEHDGSINEKAKVHFLTPLMRLTGFELLAFCLQIKFTIVYSALSGLASFASMLDG